MGDIDTILLQPDIGMFTIEVKGVSLDMIEDYGLKHCKITGRSGPHPVDQIGLATIDLRNYLGRFPGVRSPFFLMTAAFPRITRKAFVARFNDPQIVLHANSLISPTTSNPRTSCGDGCSPSARRQPRDAAQIPFRRRADRAVH